ncbi:MAG TPA: nicotinate-nucleotide adenylyltransferase [Fimbriimonadaceae bacterium]|nr:nicotinate-nucleotide adenylyltransferase [Fimbriimonadaceae bacterium]
MKIGILGGTFDPPHVGHLAVAESVRDQLELDEVVFVPAARNPMKDRRAHAGHKHRLAMLRVMAEGKPGLGVSDIEITRGGSSYMVETLEELHLVQPADYWLILGSDALQGFSEWRHPERICRFARVAAVIRPPMEKVTFPLPDYLENVLDWVECRTPNISSTRVRSMLQRRDEDVVRWLDPRVYEYIQRHRLYRIED